jgi:hypothetical protein
MFNGRFLVTSGESPKVILANGGSPARFRASIANAGHGQIEVLGYGVWDSSTGQVTGSAAKGPKIDAGTSSVVAWDGQVAVVIALVAGTGLSASGEWALEFS